MIRRWWLWLTNPPPLPGQVWRVDGLGLVTIQTVDDLWLTLCEHPGSRFRLESVICQATLCKPANVVEMSEAARNLPLREIR